MNCTKCGGNGFLLTRVRRKAQVNTDTKFKFGGNREEQHVDIDEAVPCQSCKPGLYAAYMENRVDEHFRELRRPDKDKEKARAINRKKAEEKFGL